jgi:hypothetical protein
MEANVIYQRHSHYRDRSGLGSRRKNRRKEVKAHPMLLKRGSRHADVVFCGMISRRADICCCASISRHQAYSIVLLSLIFASQTPDSKKEEYRKYLEKSGVIDALTKGTCVPNVAHQINASKRIYFGCLFLPCNYITGVCGSFGGII